MKEEESHTPTMRRSMEWNGLVDQMSRDIKPHGVVLVIKIK